MQIIFVLIAISISLALFFLISFLWATRSGQFDDTYGPSVRLLFDDEVRTEKSVKTKKATTPCK
jgi:cbb3-type cytochrome oxidase maturation protein